MSNVYQCSEQLNQAEGERVTSCLLANRTGQLCGPPWCVSQASPALDKGPTPSCKKHMTLMPEKELPKYL